MIGVDSSKFKVLELAKGEYTLSIVMISRWMVTDCHYSL